MWLQSYKASLGGLFFSDSTQDTYGMDIMKAFAAMNMGDVWQDAKLPEAIIYARGSTRLRMPAVWRPFLPETI